MKPRKVPKSVRKNIIFIVEAEPGGDKWLIFPDCDRAIFLPFEVAKALSQELLLNPEPPQDEK